MDAGWLLRPDYVFHGFGPRSLESNRSRYKSATTDAALRYELRPASILGFQAIAGARLASLGDGSFGDDPSLSQEAARGAFPIPPGFREGYTIGYQRAEITIDSRGASGAGSGVRLAGHFEHATDLRPNPGSSWIKYGGAIAGLLDMTGQDRIVGLIVTTELADPVQGGEIPFPEQVVWGGTGAMAGYRPGRLVGRSAVAATLAYQWPIWIWLNGVMHVGVGNVFGPGLADFEAKLLRLSWGLGIRSTSSPDHQIELQVGFGTETFEHGTQVTAFRLAVGGTHGF